MYEDMKEFYRENIRERRKNLDLDEINRYGKDICNIIFNTGDKELDKFISDVKVVALYKEVRGELSCKYITEKFIKCGKKICLPKVCGDVLKFYYVEDMAKDLEKGSYGILEPKEGLKEATLSDIDLIIVPAVAFNDEGVRLGQGGGYYDRLYQEMENMNEPPLTMGICYDFQINSGIPVEEHDMCVDILMAVETGDKL